jgi:phosphoribosylformylglycinamidine synthase
MGPRVGVVVFPGTNCDYDIARALEWQGASAVPIWHSETSLVNIDAVVLPGGFAHGDYLRPGALARFSPIMDAVCAFAYEGRAVLGICNGFQILTESGLLPGALQKNRDLRFLCKPVELEVTSTKSVLTRDCAFGDRLEIPINHFSGAYVADEETLASLRANDQVVLRYVTNPNGSSDDIAGISNVSGNVVGLMPHPERVAHPLSYSQDGAKVLTSFVNAVLSHAR